MRHFGLVLAEVALVIVAILMLTLPEARTSPMQFVLFGLVTVVGGAALLQTGALRLTFGEAVRTAMRAPPRVLTLVALGLSVVASVFR